MKHRRRHTAATIAAVLPLLLMAGTTGVGAVSDEEIFRDFPFNLTNPGARALGLGGAFISLADDSTAAQSNPAGLTNLRRPELFAELRVRNYDSSATSVSSTLSGTFFQGDVTSSAVSRPESSFSPSFISYVKPFEIISLGFSRLESLNIQTRTLNTFSINGTEAIVSDLDGNGEPDITGFQPVDFELTAAADADAVIVQYNVALAVEVHRRFSVGITGVVGTAKIDGRVDNMFTDNAPGSQFTQPTLDYSTQIDDSDTDIAFNAGLIWRPTDWASIGAVYRQGPRFVLEQTIGNVGVRADEAQEVFGTSFNNVIHTPDSYGLGLAFRPAEPWTILVDVVQMEYSDLMDDYVSGLNRISFPSNRAEFIVDDGTEIHLGVEKIFLSGTTPLALRFGGWSDPDHRIRAADTSGLLEVFPAGERVDHYTAGFGMTLKQAIQIDVALDISDVNSNFVFSTIYRF